MIEREGRTISICCDSCGQFVRGEDGEEFAAVLAAAKREGFKVRKIANEWLHGCKDCGVPT